MDDKLREFARRFELALDDPDLKAKYDYYMSSLYDDFFRTYYAEKKGREDGGQQEKRRIALSMLQDGIPEDIVVKYTHLPIDEIHALIEGHDESAISSDEQ